MKIKKKRNYETKKENYMNLPSTEMENLGNIIRAIIFWLDKNRFFT